MLILAGPDTLVEALRAGVDRRLLLRPDEDYPDSAHAAICARARAFGSRLFVPPAFAADAPEARVVAESGPLGEPLARRLQRHKETFGARAAVLVRPVALQLVMAEHETALSAPLLAPTLELDTDGACLFSEACCCAYTAEAADGGWRFLLFDTEQTLERRRALCEQFGLECIVLTE